MIIFFHSLYFYLRLYLFDSYRVKKEIKKAFFKDYSYKIAPAYISRLHFFGLYAVFFSRWFALLHHHALSKKEILASIYFGFCNPLFDDLIDEFEYSEERLEVIRHSTIQTFQNEYEYFLHKCYYQLLSFDVNASSLFEKYLNLLINAQFKSKTQQGNIALEEIESITRDKGAYSLLLSRSLLYCRFSDNEEKLVYSIGSLFQFINDVFDVYKDKKAGISTIPTYYLNPDKMRSVYNQYLERVINNLSNMQVKPGKKHLFLFHFLLIAGRGEICIKQFCKTQDEKGCFNPETMDRKNFICDMDLISNKIKLLLLSFKGRK